MISLGLDPSLSGYGWAVFDSKQKGRARRIASGHEGTLPSVVPPARFLHFQSMVRELIKEYPGIEVVGIESPAYDAGPFQTIHFGLMQFSMAEVFLARRDCVLFDPATREFLVRVDPKKKTGKMFKEDIQRYVQLDTLDSGFIDNNEADAYVIALFAARLKELRNGIISPEDLTPSELKKFVLMTKKKKTIFGTRTKNTGHAFRENSRFYDFSSVPQGSVSLPKKSAIPESITKYLEDLEQKELEIALEKAKKKTTKTKVKKSLALVYVSNRRTIEKHGSSQETP